MKLQIGNGHGSASKVKSGHALPYFFARSVFRLTEDLPPQKKCTHSQFAYVHWCRRSVSRMLLTDVACLDGCG